MKRMSDSYLKANQQTCILLPAHILFLYKFGRPFVPSVPPTVAFATKESAISIVHKEEMKATCPLKW